MKRVKVITIIALLLFTFGCAQTPDGRWSFGGVTKQQVGGGLGALGGGLLGSRFGDKWKPINTALGAVVGLFIGSSIGKSIDQTDQLAMEKGIGTTPINHTYRMTGKSGHQYDVTPRREFRSNQGICREFTVNAYIDNSTEKVSGTACQGPDGRWRMVGQ